MALNRLIVDDNATYKEPPVLANRVADEQGNQIDPATLQPDAAPPPQQEAPTNGQNPGPMSAPEAGQGGPPPAAQNAPPPPLASAVPGIEGSRDTGGVQGSFQQAGGREFAQRFGGSAPAVWFRNAMRGGQPPPGQSRAATARAGGYSGGAIPSESAIPSGPSQGEVGGGPQDEEWQRFMQAVLSQRFGGGRG